MDERARPRRLPIRAHAVVVLMLGALCAAGVWQRRMQQEQRLAGGRATRPSAVAAAIAPAVLPPPVRKSLIRRLYDQIWEDRVISVAAGVTFYALLAIFPTLAALVSLYGLVAHPATISQHLEHLYFFLPEGAVQVIGGQISRISSRPTETLGLTLGISLTVSLWSANAGMKALFDALNIVHGIRESRSFVWLTLQTLTFTFGAILFLLLALAGVVVLPVAIAWLPLPFDVERLVTLLRWPALAAALTAGLAVLYRWGPCRPHAPGRQRVWRGVAWGAAVAATAWLGGSMLFSWYVSRFADYDATYGSLGAAIGFMTWIWLSAIVILVGGEIDAELEDPPPA
ncbi:hypothetical protein STVA_23030 [Allostella vacuolata]|nr:hypothetical protein STVA_23030 [Stella vacuolata]